MKRWAVLVVGLYGLILLLLAGPVMLAAFWPGNEGVKFLKMQIRLDPQVCPLWAWVTVMMLAEAALLVVPVRVAAGRPVARRHVLWTVLAGAFAMCLMIAGMALAVWEHIANTPNARGRLPVALFVGVGVVWLLWSVLFAFYTGRRPRTLMSRVVRLLVAGSILELLIAVPTHIIARWRNYCCAGYMTFWGLATGISVLLFAFGPGIFILFARRWRAVTPPRPPAGSA